MEQLNVRIKEKIKEYPVFIGSSLLPAAKDFLEKNHQGKKVVIITDSNVKELCKEKISEAFKGLNPALIFIPAGESSKSRQMKEKIEDSLLEKKYGRDTVIIAIGGGVVGDLAGFIASTYNRGIPIIHIPTTLLAMVDSSIGGKTSIDTEQGKNLIGAIYQPDAVFSDLDFLDSLQKEEFLNGLVEVIKIAAALDKELFSFIETNVSNIMEKEKNSLLHIIKGSIELKKNVVEKDEKESGLRQVLNFGHTFGHAFESYSDYKSKHGYCISIGIAVESKIAVLNDDLKEKEEKKIVSLLEAFGLPVKVSSDIDIGKIMGLMVSDKKTLGQKPRFVILDRIGKIKTDKINFSFEVNEDNIRKAIEMSK